MAITEGEPVTAEIAIAGLREIFSQLQTDFHDQWDWMNAEFYVGCLEAIIDAPKEQA